MGTIGSSPRVRGTLEGAKYGADVGRFIPACAGNSIILLVRGLSTPVHPRVCGELDAGAAEPSGVVGSSPRVRGTPLAHLWRHPVDRFIPACAGNSSSSSPASRRKAGSSPRVRGTRIVSNFHPQPGRFIPACAGNSEARRCQHRPRRRFIPACAGNSRPSRRVPHVPPVHPRVCGELRIRHATAPPAVGSSPRVRGTRSQSFLGAQGAAVHPRVCGELGQLVQQPVRVRGSSPRVRGTLGHGRLAGAVWRFIPACAGNSLGSRAASVVDGRFIPACAGNSRASARSIVCAAGSSPRVRGTRPDRPEPLQPQRFIPACAGNSGSTHSPWRAETVHPRVCGELRGARRRSPRGRGSSPRVRGTRACP